MVNGGFVFGMDADDGSVFDRTVDWPVSRGIETATFHVLTPYPGTALFNRMERDGRLLHRDWNRYDTRHCVFRPVRLSPEELEQGYWRAYERFYEWGSILRGAATKPTWRAAARHAAYAAGWKKLERAWDLVIRASMMLPVLERVLAGFGRQPEAPPEADGRAASPDRFPGPKATTSLPVLTSP